MLKHKDGFLRVLFVFLVLSTSDSPGYPIVTQTKIFIFKSVVWEWALFFAPNHMNLFMDYFEHCYVHCKKLL